MSFASSNIIPMHGLQMLRKITIHRFEINFGWWSKLCDFFFYCLFNFPFTGVDDRWADEIIDVYVSSCLFKFDSIIEIFNQHPLQHRMTTFKTIDVMSIFWIESQNIPLEIDPMVVHFTSTFFGIEASKICEKRQIKVVNQISIEYVSC